MRSFIPFRRGLALSTTMVLASALFAFSVPNQASAAPITGCHFPSATVRVGTPLQAPYAAAVRSAVNAWNATPTPVNFIQLSGDPIGGVSILASNFGNTGWDGRTQMTCPVPKGANSAWNTFYTDAYSAAGKQQVMVHELGHILGLGDVNSPACSGQPVMHFTSTRFTSCGHAVPQPIDIARVNAIF
jgi:hypothetical protein